MDGHGRGSTAAALAEVPMELAKDLFLTDARAPHLSVTLASRDLDSHRLLSGLTDEERIRLHEILTACGADLQTVLRASLARQHPDATTTSFGCGT